MSGGTEVRRSVSSHTTGWWSGPLRIHRMLGQSCSKEAHKTWQTSKDTDVTSFTHASCTMLSGNRLQCSNKRRWSKGHAWLTKMPVKRFWLRRRDISPQQQPGSPTASSLPRPLRRSRKPRSPLQAGLDPGRRPCGHCPLSSYAPRRLYGDCSGFAKKLQAAH